MFAVYRAFGEKSDVSYYGYAKVEKSDAEILQRFLETAKHDTNLSSPKGATQLLNLNDLDDSLIHIEIVDSTDDEITAWTLRNDLRAQYTDSITGPSFMPWGIAQRAEKVTPEKVATWKRAIKLAEAKTAREAWRLGRWTTEQIKSLSSKFDKVGIVKNLDSMNPTVFAATYSLN